VLPEEPLKNQAAAFLEAVRTGRAPRSDGAFGAGVVRVLERIEERLQGNRPRAT